LSRLRAEIGDDRIATVWIDNPPVNAIDQALYRELASTFREVGQDARVSCVILASAGRHFCAGNDLDEFLTLSPENNAERMRVVREAFFAVQDCTLPVIAAVQGVALGTGLALVASCDFAVCAEGAKLGTPEVSVGVMGGARHLARLLPQPLVRWMYFSAEPVSAEELLAYGAVLAVVPPDELLAEARRRAAAIVRHSPVALRFAKRALGAIEHMELQPGYEREQGLSGELSAYADSKEAVRAFFERRPPRYTGT
jgi:enoyl-CoA hydratase